MCGRMCDDALSDDVWSMTLTTGCQYEISSNVTNLAASFYHLYLIDYEIVIQFLLLV